MRTLVLAIALVSCLSAFSQSNYQALYTQAREAHKAGDYKKFYELILEANRLHPYHQGILYNAARASALNNRPNEAILYLSKAIRVNADFDLNHQDFQSLQGTIELQKLKDRQAELKSAIINSDTAFVINDRTLHIECIAAGEEPGVFYLGSIRKKKIIRVDKSGNVTNFTSSGQDGLTSVFGIKIDASKNLLWACSSPTEEMENFDTSATSAVFKFDLKSGKLINKYTTATSNESIFGDLTLDSKGNVFVSDSRNNIILSVNEKTGKLDEYFSSPELWNIQGITFSDDQKHLFIADYIKGVFRLDLKTRALKFIMGGFDQSLKSIDGLTFYKNSLIAIQNQVTPMRVTQYFFDKNKDLFIDYKIIDRGHPAFNEPTIGCVSDGKFYYVANSLWSGYTDKKELKDFSQLRDVVVLRSELK